MLQRVHKRDVRKAKAITNAFHGLICRDGTSPSPLNAKQCHLGRFQKSPRRKFQSSSLLGVENSNSHATPSAVPVVSGLTPRCSYPPRPERRGHPARPGDLRRRGAPCASRAQPADLRLEDLRARRRRASRDHSRELDDARRAGQAPRAGRDRLAGGQACRRGVRRTVGRGRLRRRPGWEWRTGATDVPDEVYSLWRVSVDRSREVTVRVMGQRRPTSTSSATRPTPSVARHPRPEPVPRRRPGPGPVEIGTPVGEEDAYRQAHGLRLLAEDREAAAGDGHVDVAPIGE